MLDYCDASFLDYYASREPVSVLERNLRIERLLITSGVADGDLDIYDLQEMAATYTDDKGREHWNTNKIPLFMDEADIQYLRQFPLRFWKQALAYRYNRLLVKKWFHNRAQKELPDWNWVAVQTPNGKIKFFVDTGITKLFNKLTKPKDINKIRAMDKHQRGEYERGGGGFWQHTFDNPKFLNLQHAMDEMQRRKVHPGTEAEAKTNAAQAAESGVKEDSKRTDKVWLTEDYVGVGEATAEDRLHHWLDGIREGWLGQPQDPDDVEIRKLTWGGGGKKEQWVYTNRWLSEWVPIWQRKMKAALEAFRPELPQFIIDKMLIDFEGNKVVWKAIASNGKVVIAGKYHMPFLLPAKAIDREDVKKHDQYRDARDQVKDAIENKSGDNSKLVELINKIKSAKLPEYVEEEKQKLRDEFGKLTPEALESRLDSLAMNEAILAVKYWLKEQGINPDSISEDKVLGDSEFRNRLIAKMSDFLEHAEQRMLHIKQHATRYDVWDWVLGDHNNMYDGDKKKYKRLYKSVTFGGVFPNRQQKVKTIADPDEWNKILVYYFGQAREINGVPYVLNFNIPNVDEASSLPASAFEKGGAIWQGIHYALNSDVVMKHVPEWQTLSHHKRDLFQVINEWMMWQTGEAAFRDFMDAYNDSDAERMEQTGKLLFKRIRTKSQNFVISLFQLDILGRGTVRKRSGHKVDAQLSVVEELGQFLKAQKQTLEDLTKDLQPQHQHRTQRPMSLGASGIPGHSIGAIQSQLKAAEIARKQTDLGPAFERLATGMAKDLLVATMINIYISKMTDAGKKINRDFTYEDAETYARQVLGLDTEGETVADDKTSYEALKKEFFQKMEAVISQWDMEEMDPKEVQHSLGPGGDMAINLIYQLDKLNNNGRERQTATMLDALENSLADQASLGQKARAAGTDPEMARIAIEFVLYYFGRQEAPAAGEPVAQQPTQGFTPQQESMYLQAYMRELFGGEDPPPAGPIRIPDSTIHMIMHGDGGRQIYDRLNDYAHPTTGERPHIGVAPGQSIDLSHHPRFLELARAIVDAVNAKVRQSGTDIGGQSRVAGDISTGF